jgi:phosphodiesterase/alkaline phosphatase D-like protein
MRYLRAVTSPSSAGHTASSRAVVRATLLALALALIAALAIAGVSGHSAAAPGAPAAASGVGALPQSALGAVSSAVGAGEPVYRVEQAPAGLVASNPAQHLSVRFAASGVAVDASATRVQLGVAALGRAVPAAVAPVARANTVQYAARDLREWYRNGPLGLEQGFTVARRPLGRASTLTISVPLSGNVRARLAGRSAVTLAHAGGPTLRYGDLVASDARGRALRSWMELSRGAVLLRIDARGAHYPLRVDPLIQQGPKLTASDESGAGNLGLSVAISADGNTALVGGPSDNFGVGAAWVFTRSGSTWTQQGSKLTGSGEVGEGHFGCCALSLSADGNTALIGGYGDNSGTGAAWVFTRAGSTWTQQGSKLTAGGEVGEARFGYAVSLSADGNTALIGGGGDNTRVGAAWVFTRSGSTWTQQGSKLTGGGETGAGQFGYTVALSGDGETAMVGAGADHSSVGAAWTFTRSGSTWSQLGSKLTAAEEEGASHFGCCGIALSSDGKIALVGGSVDNASAGAAWLYKRSGSAWTQSGAKLTGGEEVGAAAFGRALAMTPNGASAVIGGPFDNESAGAAWIFVLHGAPTSVTEPATAVGQKSATLNADVTPEGETVSDCRFEYGTTEAYGASVPCNPSPGSGNSPVAVSAAVSGLSPGTTYHYRVRATNPTGTGTGSDAVFTTPASAPPAVATEPSTAVAQTSARLNASVTPEDENVSDCHFEYGTSETYGTSVPCSPSPGSGISPVAVSAALAGLSPGTTYHYRVVATNGTGTSEGSDRTFETTASQPPAAVTKPASSVAQTSATLNATVDPEDEPVSDCHFEYGTTEAYGASIPCSPSPGSGTSPVAVAAAVSGLSPSTAYHYRVVATNGTGTSEGSDRTFETTASQPPAAVTKPASSVAQTSATLNATVDPEDEPVSDCHFEYGTTEAYGASIPCSPSPGSGTSPVAVSAAITALSPNTTYHFRVVATNPIGTATGADSSFTTPIDTPVAVTKPATRVGQVSALLNGTVDPEGAPVSQCRFEYGTSESYGTNVPCSPSPGSGSSPVAVSAAISGLKAGTTYHFRLVASNAGGTSDGADATFTTASPALPELGRCITLAKATGRFKSLACTALSTGEDTGKYEWVPWPDAKGGFSAATVGTTLLETSKKVTVLSCTGGTLAGEYDGPQSSSMGLTLTGCEATKNIVGKCHSAGAAEGEVKWNPVEAHLGIVKTGTAPLAGWDLQPASGPDLANFTCGATAVAIAGSVIGQVTTLNKMSTTFAIKFKETGGKELYEKFEGGVKDTPLLDAGQEEAAGITASWTTTNEELIEIKAIV